MSAQAQQNAEPIPTRITSQPVLRRQDRGGRWRLQISCDDGRTYTLPELAAVVGITCKTLTTRIDGLGWDSPLILHPGRLTARITGTDRKWWLRPADKPTTPPLTHQAAPAPAGLAPHDGVRPTRIVAPPVTVMDRDSIGRPRRLQAVRCDDGVTYPLYRLADMLGLTQETLRCRIAHNGWDHPNVLGPPVASKGLALDGTKKNTGHEGSPEWRGLSGSPRTARLAAIAGPGPLELAYLYHHEEHTCQP